MINQTREEAGKNFWRAIGIILILMGVIGCFAKLFPSALVFLMLGGLLFFVPNLPKKK